MEKMILDLPDRESSGSSFDLDCAKYIDNYGEKIKALINATPERSELPADKAAALEAYNFIEKELSVGLNEMGQVEFQNDDIHGAMSVLYRAALQQDYALVTALEVAISLADVGASDSAYRDLDFFQQLLAENRSKTKE